MAKLISGGIEITALHNHLPHKHPAADTAHKSPSMLQSITSGGWRISLRGWMITAEQPRGYHPPGGRTPGHDHALRVIGSN